jgi:hypothetical protein
MVARDVRDDRCFLVGQSENLGGRQNVLRVFVMGAQAHIDADVVQQRRDLQEQALTLAKAMLFGELIEQPGGERRHVVPVVSVPAIPLPQGLRTGQDLPLEVFDT